MIELPMCPRHTPEAPLSVTQAEYLRTARWWTINTSGGKDSQTAMRAAVATADALGVPRCRLVAVHADLGRMEWAGAMELAERQARHYGLRFVTTKQRDESGVELELLDAILRRGMWPSDGQRYCTSDFKAGPCNRVIVALRRQHGAWCSVVNVMGMRADESTRRRRMLPWSKRKKVSNGRGPVYDWLPIHGWTAEQVWDDIHASGVPYHRAYDLGMPRLSCKFCIYGTFPALVIAGREDPDLLREYVRAEEVMGHTFRHGFSLKRVLQAVESGVDVGPAEDWEM